MNDSRRVVVSVCTYTYTSYCEHASPRSVTTLCAIREKRSGKLKGDTSSPLARACLAARGHCCREERGGTLSARFANCNFGGIESSVHSPLHFIKKDQRGENWFSVLTESDEKERAKFNGFVWMDSFALRRVIFYWLISTSYRTFRAEFEIESFSSPLGIVKILEIIRRCGLKFVKFLFLLMNYTTFVGFYIKLR